MTAERISARTYGQYPPIMRSTRAAIGEADDWCLLPEWGADVLAVVGQAGGAVLWKHPTVAVVGPGATPGDHDTDDTSIKFDGLTAGHLGTAAELATNLSFYVEVAGTGEILHVRRVALDSGGTSGTFTVSRGALGSTAAAIPNDTLLYLKRTIVFPATLDADGDPVTGTPAAQVVAIHYVPWTNDYGGARI